jgi:hypothetical protein
MTVFVLDFEGRYAHGSYLIDYTTTHLRDDTHRWSAALCFAKTPRRYICANYTLESVSGKGTRNGGYRPVLGRLSGRGEGGGGDPMHRPFERVLQ